MRYLLLILVVVSLTACFKEELPIAKVDRGNAIVNQVNLGNSYTQQVYFDLETNSMVKSIDKYSWDIAFDCSGSKLIYQNTAITASASVTHTDVFEDVNSSTPTNFRYDYHDLNPDSLGMGKWFEDGKVIIIDRGSNWNGASLGKIKFQVISWENNTFTFRYSRLNGSDYHEASVTTDEDYNQVGYSFTNHSPIFHQPKKTDYDILFSGYIQIFYEPGYMPYSVVGALINPYRTKAARDVNDQFDNFTIDAIDTLSFSSKVNAIGYDWKVVNINTSQYTVYPEITYIIEDSDSYYYKLHFVDYYNDLGERGAPKFEFQRL